MEEVSSTTEAIEERRQKFIGAYGWASLEEFEEAVRRYELEKEMASKVESRPCP